MAKLTLREKLIARLTELCSKAEATGRATMNIKRKDLLELFGTEPDDLKAIVHSTNGGADTFVRVEREYLADRLSKLSSPAPAAATAKPVDSKPAPPKTPGSQ